MVSAAALLPGNLLTWLLAGLVAGFLASIVMRGGRYGIIGDIIIGIIGAFIGGFIMGLLGFSSGGLISSIIVAFIGACILIGILRVISSGVSRRRHVTRPPEERHTASPMSPGKAADPTTPPIQPTQYRAILSNEQRTPQTPPPVWFQQQLARPIFVSHSSKDDIFGRKLIKDIQQELGSRVSIWYDSDGGLYGGDEWWDKIVEQLDKCDIFIIILSPNAVNSYWVKKELNTAIVARKRILPVLYKACTVRADLQAIHTISFLPPIQYETALTNLLQSLTR